MKSVLCFIHHIKCDSVDVWWPTRWNTPCQCVAHTSRCLLRTLYGIACWVAGIVAPRNILQAILLSWAPTTAFCNANLLGSSNPLGPTIWPRSFSYTATLWGSGVHIFLNVSPTKRFVFLNKTKNSNVLIFFIKISRFTIFNLNNAHTN